MSASRKPRSDSNSTADISLTAKLESNLTQLDPKDETESPAAQEDGKMASSRISSNIPDDGGGTSEAAAAVNDASSEDDALLNKQHFTRSKNSVKTNNGNAAGGKNGIYSLDAVGSEEGVDEAAMITECSLLLARVDDRAYQSALIRDANQIVERITLPMSFPWHHSVLPVVRNIPRDIDEMPAILTIEDEGLQAFGNGPLGYGGFETGKQRRRAASGKEGIRIAARRADDVGVIELTMLKLPGSPVHVVPTDAPTKPNGTKNKGVSLLNDFWQHTPADQNVTVPTSTALKQPWNEDELVDGMLSLESYTIAQARKRRKVEHAIANTQRIFVSVKVGGASSRSSLFAPYAIASTPLLREAICPQEVQQGKPLPAVTAKKLSDEIGTYDCRYGAPRSTLVAKSSNNRVNAGRTRLMWTYNSSDINKALFSSTLNRERLELCAQKRPTTVRVGMRLNGALVALEADLSKSRLSDSKASGKPEEIPYSGKAVDAAINAACATPNLKPPKPQCLIDIGKFLASVRLARGETTSGNTVELPYGVSVVRPVIDCLPLNHGAIVTTCSVPGKLQSVCVQECLNKAARRQGLLCTVCWTGSQPRFAVEECACGLTAHLACLSDRGERIAARAGKNEQASKTWKCPACSAGVGVVTSSAIGPAPTEKRAKRATKIPAWLDNDQVAFTGASKAAVATSSSGEDVQRCGCCPHTGGAMSATTATNGDKVWIHEVCRIWQQPAPATTAMTSSEPMICALCGTSNSNTSESAARSSPETTKSPNFITKCAANGCNVRFHPMCALLVSKLAEEEDHVHSSAKEPASPQARLPNDKKHDIRLTNKYTLTMAQVSYNAYTEYTNGGIGTMKSREKNSALVPLAFCGIHNPERDATLFGCYPGGLHLDEANLRIPPKRKRGARLSH